MVETRKVGSQVELPDAVLVDMVADAKGVAADIDETIAAIKGLRARVFGEHRQIEDRRPLSRPGDAPFHQGGGDAGALGRRAAIELMQFRSEERRVGKAGAGRVDLGGRRILKK